MVEAFKFAQLNGDELLQLTNVHALRSRFNQNLSLEAAMSLLREVNMIPETPGKKLPLVTGYTIFYVLMYSPDSSSV